MMKKNYKKIISIIGGFILIIIVITLLFNSKIVEVKYPYSGIYKNDNDVILIYQADKEKLYFIMESLGSDGQALINNNIAVGSRYSVPYKYVFSFNNGALDFETDDNHFMSDHYLKVDDISLKEFFEKKYESSEYFNSNYNGNYVKDNNEIKMFQVNEKSVRACLKSDIDTLCLPFDIINKNLLQFKFSDNIYSIKIENNYITFNTNNIIFQKYNANYEKTSNISMIDIIEFDFLYQ